MKKLLLIAVLLAPAGAAAQIPTGTVSGEIRTREGQPAVGVRVSAMAVPEAGVPANSGTALVSIGTTDNQGRYRLENVLPGRYYITAGFVDAADLLSRCAGGVRCDGGERVVGNSSHRNQLCGCEYPGCNGERPCSQGDGDWGRWRSTCRDDRRQPSGSANHDSRRWLISVSEGPPRHLSIEFGSRLEAEPISRSRSSWAIRTSRDLRSSSSRR